ncbi:MAG: hypothetical protein KBF21_13625 [Thermoanaerobaculia bacterium]|nr:hypothetical protein [Thermoanaerobaculia bacterium]MBP9825258.1 hypothetical protein [Thermoanaerobaculia bacterium]
MGEPVPDLSARPPSTDGERRRESARSTRLIAVFLLGCAGFVGPLLRATSHEAPVGFWPLPFVFLFAFWLLLIVLIALALRSRPGE